MSQMQPIRLLTPSFCAGMSNSLAQTLTISNYVFTCLFACEMVLKLFALGFIEYIADRFNCFDGVVVILSIIEIILDVSLPTLIYILCLSYRFVSTVLFARSAALVYRMLGLRCLGFMCQ